MNGSEYVSVKSKPGCPLNFQLSTNKYKYAKNFPYFKEPNICGNYSLSGTPGIDRTFHLNLQQLKYYNPKFFNGRRLNLDLSHGLSSTIHKNEELSREERFDHILQWVVANKRLLSDTDSEILSTDFICFRGLLTMIMATPYETKEGWIIYATKYHNTIYMRNYETEYKQQERENATQRQNDMCSWGFKFEQYLLSDSPNVKPNVEIPVNENEEFCCLFRTKLNNHSLLYGAEMDGYKSDVPISQTELYKQGSYKNFVELKTSRIIEAPNHDRTYKRYKLLKWWMQSFLVGIPEVICGFRDDDGFVKFIEEIKTFDMPKIAKDFWNANVCMNFLDEFLSFVKSVALKDDPCTLYRFIWEPRSDVIVEEVYTDRNFIVKDWYHKQIFQKH